MPIRESVRNLSDPDRFPLRRHTKTRRQDRRAVTFAKLANLQSAFSSFHHSPLTGVTLQIEAGLASSRKRRVVPCSPNNDNLLPRSQNNRSTGIPKADFRVRQGAT